MKTRHIINILADIGVLSAYVIGGYYIHKESHECKYQIELKSGEFYESYFHYTNDGGMTRINLCGDEGTISIPAKDIKIIKGL